MGIADFDVIGLSNLQRQILHFTSDIGRKKVDSATEKLTALNPDVKILTHPERVNIHNIEDLVGEYDVIIDAADNFPARYLVSDCCYFLKKPVVEGAVSGYDGVLMTIIPDQSPCYRCVYPFPPKDGVIPTCNDTWILGMVAGVIGSLQALEAVKVLLKMGQTISGRVLTFDSLNLTFEEIPCQKHPGCPLCGANPVDSGVG